MVRIFISYRRSDSQANTDRIYDRLAAEFGGRNIFKDVDNIPIGQDFRTIFDEEVQACDMMLIVIGCSWADATDAGGDKRLFDPDDFVRVETESGLARDGLPVVPVLVNEARMPSESELPPSLAPLCYRNAIEIRNDPHFNDDVARLIRRIYRDTRSLQPQAKKRRLPKWDWKWLVGAVMIPIIAALIGILPDLLNNDGGTELTASPTTAVAQIATDTPAGGSTLSGFQQLQTTEAELTHAAETQAALNLTATEGAIQGANATGTAQQFAATETAAHATLIALSATPTNTPTPTNMPTRTPNVTLAPTAVDAQLVICDVIGAGDITTEGVVICNTGSTVDLGGWMLSDGDGNTYIFPEYRRMFSGAGITVNTRVGENTPFLFFWGRDTAVFGPGDIIVLTDSDGNVQASIRLPEAP